MKKIGNIIHTIDGMVWGPAMLTLLLGTGIYLMLRLRFLPLRNLGIAMKWALGTDKEKSAEGYGRGKERAEAGEGISSFSSLMTELAATIGTGNIVGVATAMMLGGPGALFWMMVSGLIGMATKLVESMLSVKYRSKNSKGEYVGGPMYTLKNAFPRPEIGSALAAAFAVFAVLASLGMGNMTQSNSIALAMKSAFKIPLAKTGLAVTLVTILAVLGGIRTISKVTQVIVPVMGTFYMVGSIAVIASHWENVPAGLGQICVLAFAPQAAAGGAAGTMSVSVLQSLRWGVSRGVFSNEAGLGVSGISAAAAETKDYIKQGYVSMTGVFLDTIVICSVTGLALCASGVLGRKDETGALITGTGLIIEAFVTAFGDWGAYFICICITLFAFATIVGWAYQGEKAFEFLVKKPGYCIFYRFIYALTAFVGAVCTLETVWDFSDICNALLAVPNLICVLAFSGEACREIRENDRRRRLSYKNRFFG